MRQELHIEAYGTDVIMVVRGFLEACVAVNETRH